MDEAGIVLQAVHQELSTLDRDVIGDLELGDDAVTVLDGNVRLTTAVIVEPDSNPNMAHCHITARIKDHESESLDACVFGIEQDRGTGLKAAADYWARSVAPPIFSLIHGAPVLGAIHFDGSEPYGVSGCHGFLGSLRASVLPKSYEMEWIWQQRLFDYAAELAPPRIVHLAKITLNAHQSKWKRFLEINGHGTCHADDLPDTAPAAPQAAVLTQFAAFFFPVDGDAVHKKREVDDVIRHFVEAFSKTGDVDVALERLAGQGDGHELLHRVYSFVPIAFGRVLFSDIGIQLTPYYTTITSDGSIVQDCHLMREPVFARSMVLCPELLGGPYSKTVEALAAMGGEVKAIDAGLREGANPRDIDHSRLLIPAHNACQETVKQAFREMESAPRKPTARKKRWWRL